MTNNDKLRRLRFMKNFSDQEMIEIFKYAGLEVSKTKVTSWLKKDDHPEYIFITDLEFATFLAGLIIKYRGKKEGFDSPKLKKA